MPLRKTAPAARMVTIRCGKNKGKPLAKVSRKECVGLEHIGRERALACKFLILTGLRRNEAASVTVGSLCHDGGNPHVYVERKHAKSGRAVDVHGLRHTFATFLARNGVSPGVAQKLMRHSDIRLTMNTYTHLGLADTAGAVAALPSF